MPANLRDLVARLGSGELSRQELAAQIAAVARSKEGDPFLIPAKLRPTGVVLRILDVDVERGNTGEGVVAPGAVQFTQRINVGTWRQVVTFGSGTVSVNSRRRSVEVGDVLEIKKGQRFVLINEGRKPWGFKLQTPAWGTSTFSYTYERRNLKGDEIWFGLRNSPEEKLHGGLFRVLPAAGPGTREATATGSADATDCVALLSGGEQLQWATTTTGSDEITVLAGDAEVTIAGARTARPRRLVAGQSAVARGGRPYRLANPSRSRSVVLIQPKPPRVWEPETSLFDLQNGEFSTGEQVWFELVLPF